MNSSTELESTMHCSYFTPQWQEAGSSSRRASSRPWRISKRTLGTLPCERGTGLWFGSPSPGDSSPAPRHRCGRVRVPAGWRCCSEIWRACRETTPSVVGLYPWVPGRRINGKWFNTMTLLKEAHVKHAPGIQYQEGSLLWILYSSSYKHIFFL